MANLWWGDGSKLIVGIVGKPNTGKSTFFNAATLLDVPVANYPFTTVSPNFGVGSVRVKCVCRDLDVDDNPVNSVCIEGSRFIPVKLVDIAGLVPGASEGRGLGNKFLDEIRQADALIHVIDASGSTDEEGKVAEIGSHDPLVDIPFVENEFDIWLLSIVKKDWGKISRGTEGNLERFVDAMADRLSGLSIRKSQILSALDNADLKGDKSLYWGDDDLKKFCTLLRTVSKPSLIAANKADLPNVRAGVDGLRVMGRKFVPTAAEAELLLRRASAKNLIHYLPGDDVFNVLNKKSLSEQQSKALKFVREMVLNVWGSTGVQEAINSVFFDLLQSIVVYPVEDESKYSNRKGNILPDAYLVRDGSTARDLAYKVHTDLGAGFLYALNARSGKRLASDYILQDGDVIKIISTGKR